MSNLKTQLLVADDRSIALGADLLKQGKLVVFPTETVYGLGANGLDPQAVAGIFKAKGRPGDNPLILHLGDLSQITPLVKEIPPELAHLAAAFWPGPLTLVLQKSSQIPLGVSAGLETVAIRIPSDPTAHKLLAAVGLPIAAPSANRSGSPSPTTAQHVLADLGGRVDLILDGGPCTFGVESTVLSLVGEQPLLLRPGSITPEELEQVIGPILISPGVMAELDADQPALSPGLKHRHYAPKAVVQLLHGTSQAFTHYANNNALPNTWVMAFTEDLPSLTVPAVAYGSVNRPEEQAALLFARLRQLDESGATTILVHAPQPVGIGLAVYNRLLRAASFNEHYLL